MTLIKASDYDYLYSEYRRHVNNSWSSSLIYAKKVNTKKVNKIRNEIGIDT